MPRQAVPSERIVAAAIGCAKLRRLKAAHPPALPPPAPCASLQLGELSRQAARVPQLSAELEQAQEDLKVPCCAVWGGWVWCGAKLMTSPVSLHLLAAV